MTLTKKELRKEILAGRTALSEEEVREKSRAICLAVRGTEAYAKATDICIYMPIRNEVDVRMIVEEAAADGKRLWIPKVIGEEMIFNEYDEELMEPGAFDIPESRSEIYLEAGEDTLIIMPGAVFDRYGNRIGYGGGFYDRYLEKHPECMTMAVCYDMQVVDHIPAESHDIRPQIIVTESGILTYTRRAGC